MSIETIVAITVPLIALCFTALNKAIQKDLGELSNKVARVEQSVEEAHRRIDEMKG